MADCVYNQYLKKTVYEYKRYFCKVNKVLTPDYFEFVTDDGNEFRCEWRIELKTLPHRNSVHTVYNL